MKHHILKYILFVSLLLNFSLLGAAGYTHYQQTRRPATAVGHDVQGAMTHGSAAQGHLFEALSLQPAQLKIFRERALPFHKRLDEKKAIVAQRRTSLLDLMRAENPDRHAVEAAIKDINGVQREMQAMVVAHMLEFKSMLDKDQQKKFLNLIQEAMAEKDGMRCP